MQKRLLRGWPKYWNLNALVSICIVSAYLALGPRDAIGGDDPRHQAVKDLGTLNGVALQCRYLDEVRRMKQAVVANAPKQRSFGLAFDEATNQSFLAFIRARGLSASKVLW